MSNKPQAQIKQEPILDFVIRRLNENKGILTKVAIGSGVPYSTLMKVAQGVNANPRIETVQKLADYFQNQTA